MSLMKKKLGCCLVLLFMASIVIAEVKVTNVSVKPRWPWNGLVDITYSIECDEKDDEGKPKDVYVEFKGIDNDRGVEVPMKSLTGQGAKDAVKNGGPYTVIWDMAKDAPAFNSSSFKVKIHAIAGIALYLVVDLSGGPDAVSYPVHYTDQPPNLDDDTCRTTELWLRRIPAGKFIMGSPEDEVGRYYNETQHEVTLTQDYYIGVFECTQRQWELVVGNRPSYFNNVSFYATRPVEQISYDMIRGKEPTAGAGWPNFGHTVDVDSFMGILQAKTGLKFDLPTEAEWEYACRAGTTTALNSNQNLTDVTSCINMDLLGRYWYNGGSAYSQTCAPSYGTAKVGSYLPNAWGLYDMHGNLWEWCLDWLDTYPTIAVVNPKGANSGTRRVKRGGGWSDTNGSSICRAAYRGKNVSSNAGYTSGFRVCYYPE